MEFFTPEFFTSLYIPGQVVVLIIVIGFLWRIKGWRAHTNTAASILTMVGVLGTFIGIYMGLQDFNADELQNSISGLLNGLRVAFGTSILGIISALLLKGLISPLVQKIQKQDDPGEEAINKFVEALKGALESVQTSGESALASKLDALITTVKQESIPIQSQTLSRLNIITDALSDKRGNNILTKLNGLTEKMEQSIPIQSQASVRLNIIANALSDQSGNNLLTELNSLKTEISNKHDKLRAEFQDFSKNVADSVAKLATDELIEALKGVIEDFNAKLTEQFGENFKHLNQAVERTVTWQEQYRQQMDELAKEFRIAAGSIEQSQVSIGRIAESSITIAARSERIVDCAEQLAPILHALNEHLEAFRKLGQDARNAFPEIESRLDTLTRDFSNAVQQVIKDSHGSMEHQRTELQAQTALLKKGVEEATKQLKGIVERNKEDIENHVNTLNETLRKEWSDSLQTLAGYVESLSNGFVDNYKELAGSYNQVITDLKDLVDRSRQVLG